MKKVKPYKLFLTLTFALFVLCPVGPWD